MRKSEGRDVKSETNSVDVWLEEVRRLLDVQFSQIEALDTKASVVLGSASLISTLVPASQTSLFSSALPSSLPAGCGLVLAGFIIAIVLYVCIVILAILAFRVRVYTFPLKIDRREIEEDYLPLTGEMVKKQVLSNYLKHLNENTKEINRKARFVQWSLIVLAIDVVYLIVMVYLNALMF